MFKSSKMKCSEGNKIKMKDVYREFTKKGNYTCFKQN